MAAEEVREGNSVPAMAGEGGDLPEPDRKLNDGGVEKEEGEGEGGEEGKGPVSSEEKRDDSATEPSSQREPAIEAEPTADADTPCGEDSDKKLFKVTPKHPPSPSEDAPVVNGSSSVEMGSPADSDSGPQDNNNSPTQTDSPNPVERTDSMSSGALLLPREQ